VSIFPEVEDLARRPDERLIHEWFGRHEQSHLLTTRVPKPGKIVLTDQRLAFQPQKMGLAIHTLGIIAGVPVAVGDEWSTELSDIADVIDRGASTHLTEQGRMFVVERRFGLDPETFFVTTSSDEMLEMIRTAVAAADPAAGATREKWSIAANSVQAGVAVGGRLSMFAASLVFVPNDIETALDSLVGSPLQPVLSMLGRDAPSQARELPLADIASVDRLEGELKLENVLSGGLRDRLVIRTKSGAEEILVVNDLDATMKRIRRCLPH
jgi:hypothetical protein